MRKVLPIAALGLAICPATAFAQTPPAFTSATRYDATGQVTGTIAPDPDGIGGNPRPAVRNTYDAAGNLIKVETGGLSDWQDESIAPASWSGFSIHMVVETTYDGMGRKLSQTTKDAGLVARAVTQFSYDSLGRLECQAVRMNPAAFGSLPASACALGTEGTQGPDRITRNFYDAAGQLIKVQQGVGTNVQIDYARYEYSANGKRTAVIDANGNRAEMTYDGHDRRARWIFPSKTAVGAVDASDYEEYAYDPNGNRTSLRKRDGQTIGYSYDALNRVEIKDLPGTTTADVYYGYDLRGLQLYTRFGSTGGQGITNVYDGFGRLSSSTTNQGGTSRTLAYEWDASGNRTRVTHPDGVYFTSTYDGLDRLSAILENGTTQVAAISYDSQGRRSGSTRGGVVSSYGYDGISRLNSLTDNLAGTANDVTLSFTHNPASQIITRGRSNDAYRFTGYVNVDRTYAVNGLNQYTTAGSATFCHDANGNLTLDGASAYRYDVENRFIEKRAQVDGTCPTVNYAGIVQATMAYDPVGRLYETTDGGTGITRFIYDGDELTLELDSSGAVLRRYVHGTGEDDPLLWYEGSAVSSATRRSLQADHQGSIVSVADSVGASLGIRAYDEYGIPVGGPANLRFQYTGQAWIPELGMYHYKARIYSPTLGRFLQTDPIGYDDQVNLYAYVGNDPVNAIDPSGRKTTIITHYDGGLGHTAIFVDAGNGKKILYDPGGSFAFRKGGGTGDALVDDQVDLKDYIKFHQKNGESMRFQTIDTDQETDSSIINNIDKQGGGAPLLCTSRVCDAVHGTVIGNIVEGSMIPSRYAENVANSSLTLTQDRTLNPDGTATDNLAQQVRSNEAAARRRDFCQSHPGANC